MFTDFGHVVSTVYDKLLKESHAKCYNLKVIEYKKEEMKTAQCGTSPLLHHCDELLWLNFVISLLKGVHWLLFVINAQQIHLALHR